MALVAARMLWVTVAAIGVVAGAVAETESTGQAASQHATAPLPAAKRTTLDLYVTAREAYERWQAAPDDVKIIPVGQLFEK